MIQGFLLKDHHPLFMYWLYKEDEYVSFYHYIKEIWPTAKFDNADLLKHHFAYYLKHISDETKYREWRGASFECIELREDADKRLQVYIGFDETSDYWTKLFMDWQFDQEQLRQEKIRNDIGLALNAKYDDRNKIKLAETGLFQF